jgi:serine/threonine-protein kinase
MSPEQLRAARDVDARSDIWSLGATLYELLSGTQPFIAPTLTALSLKIVGEPHAPLQDVPRELAAIVDRCLAKERQDRFANVAELAAALAPLFPNGRVHAEMVAGSLWHAVPPTLHGLESSAALAVVPAPPLPSTTTDLTAGESAPMRPRPRRRAAWIALGVAMAGAITMTGIVLSQRSTGSASPTSPAAAPPPILEAAPPPAPEVAPPPIPTPVPAVSPPPPEPAPAPPPETAPAPPPVKKTVPRPLVKRPPVKPPVKPPTRDPRAPIEPPDYTTDPVKDPPRAPPSEPVKKPCAPNDPACGL